MSLNLMTILREARKKNLKPAPKLNLIEWSDSYRFLSPESSAMPGRWRTDRIAAAKGPMLAVTDPKVKKITVMGPTQLLKTELINNIVGYFVHQDPAPMIVMQPTQAMAEAWSKDRLDKMIRDTPVLNELIKSKKSRDSDNTIYHKSFPGGHITAVWPSPSQLASRPVRVVLRDEVDKYEDSNEGDPSALIAERTATFWNALDVGVCSPTIKGSSKIEEEYLKSDQRKFHVDCPHCDHNHFMEWDYVIWQDRDASTAAYHCPNCGTEWTEKERKLAIEAAGNKPDGGYVATAPFTGHAGFHMNKLASPWETVPQIVQKWLDAQGNIEKIKAFKNTQLAETFEEAGDAPEYMRLYERRESYAVNSVPPEVGFITAGVDVQKDRLEVEIVGWVKGKRSYSIDYRVIMGETSTKTPWLELDKILNESWSRPDGTDLSIRVMAVDSGYNTQHVYSWARKYAGTNRVMVVKGQDALQQLVGVPSTADVTHEGVKARRGVKVWPVGVSTAKSELYGWLNQDGAGDDGVYPDGYCHFPEYDERYFRMLTAEKLVTRVNKRTKQTVTHWVKDFERNEALDCRVYARAAANMAGMDRWKDEHWEQLGGRRYSPPPPKQTASVQSPRVQAQRTNNGSSFWNGNRKKSFW